MNKIIQTYTSLGETNTHKTSFIGEGGGYGIGYGMKKTTPIIQITLGTIFLNIILHFICSLIFFKFFLFALINEKETERCMWESKERGHSRLMSPDATRSEHVIKRASEKPIINNIDKQDKNKGYILSRSFI